MTSYENTVFKGKNYSRFKLDYKQIVMGTLEIHCTVKCQLPDPLKRPRTTMTVCLQKINYRVIAILAGTHIVKYISSKHSNVPQNLTLANNTYKVDN